MEKEISQAVVRRMPRYYRYLGELLDDGVERISSNELSTRMRVTASQIRQDLNNFGGFGQQGYGYNVKYLYSMKSAKFWESTISIILLWWGPEIWARRLPIISGLKKEAL